MDYSIILFLVSKESRNSRAALDSRFGIPLENLGVFVEA